MIPTGPSSSASGRTASDKCKVLLHAQRSMPSKDVTTLEWSTSGHQLATGSYDGHARIWTLEGQMLHFMTGHNGPIFSLRWTKDDRYLLSGGVDRTARIWDATTGKEVRRFSVHQAPVLDVAWMDKLYFASCSSDKSVCLMLWDKEEPVHRWEEHQDEVNAVVWDPDGLRLASCSDDRTIKIWHPKKPNSIMTLQGHNREIYTVRWRPGKAGAPSTQLLSASFDGTARLWNVEDGTCVFRLRRHKQPVYSIEFSTDGEFLVVGSFDRTIEVYHTDSGKCFQSFTAPAGVFDLAWCDFPDGPKISVATAKGAVSVFDVRNHQQFLNTGAAAASSSAAAPAAAAAAAATTGPRTSVKSE
jgi:transducin (beta)-like 1